MRLFAVCIECVALSLQDFAGSGIQIHVPFNVFRVAQFDFVLVTVEVVIQVTVGNRGTRMQFQNDLVQSSSGLILPSLTN